MSLSYLTGDDIGKGKKKSSSGGGSKKTKPAKKTKEQKKAGKKRVFKKVAKVAVAPARAAFLSVCKLNLLKISTKIVRVWKQPNGKEQLTKFWTGFGGNMDAFKKAVSQGAKDKISGEKMGAVAATTVIATATPIIVALVPILKQFKAAGSPEEAQQFNDGVEDGKKALSENEDVPKSKVSMPQNKDSGIVVDKGGEAQEDEKQTAKNESESKSGGNDTESGEPDEKKKGVKSEGASDADSGGEAKSKVEKAMASNFSPLGLFFMTAMYIMFFKFDGVLAQWVSTYCFIGMVLIPFTKYKVANVIVYTPINIINNLIHLAKTKWQRA